MPKAHVLVATDGKIAQMRVSGQATFACSQGLRDFGLKMIESGTTALYIDLSECVSMDSTFMGVLSMISISAKKSNVPVTIVNAADSLQRLLATLGVKKLFQFTRTSSDNVDWQSVCEATPEPAAGSLARERTILEAHETLMEIDPENIPKFKDVVEFLREDIRKLEA